MGAREFEEVVGAPLWVDKGVLMWHEIVETIKRIKGKKVSTL